MTSGEAITAHIRGEAGRFAGQCSAAIASSGPGCQGADPGSAACSPCDLTQATSCL